MTSCPRHWFTQYSIAMVGIRWQCDDCNMIAPACFTPVEEAMSKNRPVFDEVFGEVPRYLLHALQASKVTPAEFYMMETMNLAGRAMWEHIRTHTVGGMYHAPLPGQW